MKKIQNPLHKLSKLAIIAMYEAKARNLAWFERLETLRARYCQPFAILTIDLAEFDRDAKPGETLTAKVYAPLAADGGVINVVWRGPGSVNNNGGWVYGYEDWLRERLSLETHAHYSLGEKILAERIGVLVDQRRPKRPDPKRPEPGSLTISYGSTVVGVVDVMCPDASAATKAELRKRLALAGAS